MIDFLTPKGYWKKVNIPNGQKTLFPSFSFRKAFRDFLGYLNVPYYDPCCSDTPVLFAPIRYNTEDETSEYYNGTDWTPYGESSDTATFGTISESVAGEGVTVDGVLLKDGGVVISKDTQTQLTSKTTTVVSNSPAGVITTVALTDAADTSFTFTLTNSFIVGTSVVLPTVNMNGGNGHAHVEIVPGTGSATVTVTNIGTAAFNSAIKIGFLVI